MSSSTPYGPGFVPLSPAVFLSTPPADVKISNGYTAKEPYLILVTSWMNAAHKHIARYLKGFNNIYPTSRILLIITTSKHVLYQPTKQRLTELQPAINLLQQLQPNESVLLQSFSNGGAITIWQMARAYRLQTGSPLPISKVVFDSAPSGPDYESGVEAFRVGLPPSTILRVLGVILIRCLFAIWYAFDRLTSTTNILDLMRAGLNAPDLVTTDAARLYIYSIKDRLVPYNDIEVHAKEAGKLGYNVRRLRYLQSGHVAHLRQDEQQYWTAVTSLWNSDHASAPELIEVA